MNPREVKPEKFKVHTIVYETEDFAIAFGIWENGDGRLAMRWNGSGKDIGYPSQGGNPLWFQLPNTGVWTSEILNAISRIESTEKQMEDLRNKLSQ